MRHRVAVAPLLTALLLQAGCGLLLGSGPDPIVQGTFPDPLEEAPPTTFIYTGEIKDFATFRPEPEATIEFWSEYPSYTPTVRLDGRGGFSIRVDTCRRPATALDDVDEPAPRRRADQLPGVDRPLRASGQGGEPVLALHRGRAAVQARPGHPLDEGLRRAAAQGPRLAAGAQGTRPTGTGLSRRLSPPWRAPRRPGGGPAPPSPAP